MPFCSNCGGKLEGDEKHCPYCGTNLSENYTAPAVNTNINNNNTNANMNMNMNTQQTTVSDSGGFGWGVLGFFLPLVGLILYLVWKNEKPKTALMVGKGALISVGLTILTNLLGFGCIGCYC